MPKDMFRDIVDPTVKVGSQQWYTVPVSILVHTAAVLALIVIPFWIAGRSPTRILIGVFFMQFFVQGAWGVIPAHINELVPGHLRGFMPGVAYQLGILCASSIPYLEALRGEKFTYTQAMGGLMTLVVLGGVVVTLLGPEARGVSFRKAHHGGR